MDSLNGLDRIIDGILDDARQESEKLVSAAKQQADEITADAEEKARKVVADAKSQAENEYSAMVKNAKSASVITEKQILLREKQEIIEDIIKAAKEKILKLNDADYFKLMERLLDKCADGEKGELVLSERDKARVSDNFKSAAKSKGLEMLDKTRSIDGGFVLVYGDIEENCSITAIMESESERLYDAVNSFLF